MVNRKKKDEDNQINAGEISQNVVQIIQHNSKYWNPSTEQYNNLFEIKFDTTKHL